MFDFHLHSRVSFDSTASPMDMVRAAERVGLSEMCFTDHYDYNTDPKIAPNLFTVEQYGREYDDLTSDSVLIRRGVEFGMTTWNRSELDRLLAHRRFDFVIGSVHFVDGYDPYEAEYWKGKTVREAFEKYLEQTLACVKIHDQFDVLGHLNYVCKSAHNPTHEPLRYEDFSELCDEIMKAVIARGKGMEINTSGVDRVGDFLPSAACLKRYRELGGEIVTLGSDAHAPERVGQYAKEALALLKPIFGYVCTFEDRKPIFHKIEE